MALRQKIVALPGARLTPEVVLARVLEEAPTLEGVVIVFLRKKESAAQGEHVVEADWSDMDVRDLLYCERYLTLSINDGLMHHDEDGCPNCGRDPSGGAS